MKWFSRHFEVKFYTPIYKLTVCLGKKLYFSSDTYKEPKKHNEHKKRGGRALKTFVMISVLQLEEAKKRESALNSHLQVARTFSFAVRQQHKASRLLCRLPNGMAPKLLKAGSVLHTASAAAGKRRCLQHFGCSNGVF